MFPQLKIYSVGVNVLNFNQFFTVMSLNVYYFIMELGIN